MQSDRELSKLPHRRQRHPQQNNPGLAFNMRLFYSDLPLPSRRSGWQKHLSAECDTTACIAGWTVLALGHGINQERCDIVKDAQALLGLSYDQALELFFMKETKVGLDQVDDKRAAAVLRNLAETGVVDWSIQ